MPLDLTRRKFLIGVGLVGIAPAVVKAQSIMRARPVDPVDDLPMTASEVRYYQQRLLGGIDRAIDLVVGDLITLFNVRGFPSGKTFMVSSITAPVAQLDRAVDSGSEG